MTRLLRAESSAIAKAFEQRVHRLLLGPILLGKTYEHYRQLVYVVALDSPEHLFAEGMRRMTPEEFAAVYPAVIKWIRQTLAHHARSAKPVASRGFRRLPLYFSQELLDTTKFVPLSRVPMPPLSSMGLQRFRDFERGDFDGITYLDTYFVKRTKAADEELHFHELVHVMQWRLLGPERFLKLYADGLERFGYVDSPLEKMAYNAQAEFSGSKRAFDAEALVLGKLRKMSAP